VFIYLVSNESVTSPYCQAEFAEALRLRKVIVTVQVRDKTRLSDELNEIQYVDMKQVLNDDNLARLIRSINEQAALPKKRRPLSNLQTSLPAIPEDENREDSARADVETPTLKLQQPAPAGDRRVAWATAINRLIVGILGLIGVIAVVLISSNLNPPSTGMSSGTNSAQNADLPLPTLTEMSPAISTSDPLQTALNDARSFNGSNNDWQALYPDGFRQIFEGGIPMVLVPVGCFMMGSMDGEPNELPVNERCFDAAFWIDLTEVTLADFKRLGGTHASDNIFNSVEPPIERILATGHKTKVRWTNGRKGITEGEAALDIIPAPAKDAQVVAVMAVDQIKLVSGFQVATDSDQPEVSG
jgi:hypothetical protein